WTTQEQREWLQARLPAFREARAKGKASAWFSATYEEWFEAFPLDPVTEEELRKADNDQEKAKDTKAKDRQNQVYWWFYNRRSSETTGKRVAEEDRKNTVDLMKNARRQILPYQAYMSL
ncbi:hypothetical protein C8Q73DRAFT_617320, partial [Cubamyces lactineus]